MKKRLENYIKETLARNPNSDELTRSEISQILRKLGYRWSNEAQCYYSTDFEMPILTDNEGKTMAKRINKVFNLDIKHKTLD